MFARLMNAIYPPGAPSALVVVGKSDASILHLVPEDSSVERFGITKSSSNTTFRHRGATEQTREQIGTITLHVGDGEGPDEFLDDVETRACTLWNDTRSSSTAQVRERALRRFSCCKRSSNRQPSTQSCQERGEIAR
jgi:hypothetical protein